jgi:hypothetical protein
MSSVYYLYLKLLNEISKKTQGAGQTFSLLIFIGRFSETTLQDFKLKSFFVPVG